MIKLLAFLLFLLGTLAQPLAGMFDCLEPVTDMVLVRVGDTVAHTVSAEDWAGISHLAHTNIWDKKAARYTVPDDLHPEWELHGEREGVPFVIFIDDSATTDVYYLFPVPNPAQDWHCCGGVFTVDETALMDWLQPIYFDWWG